jgi:hypothetical protein
MVSKSQSALSQPLLHHPILILLHLCPPLMTKPETRASSLDINSLSDQSSILALHSINEITASFEANVSFVLSTTSHLNASDSSMVGAQLSKCPWLASQQSDAVVDLSKKSSMLKPHEQLLSSNFSIMDVPGDGNRNYLMDYLLLHGSHFHPLRRATNRSLVLILLFKVCTLLIKFASDFSVKSSSLEVFEQLSFLMLPCQSSTWAPCLYGMGQLPLFICPPPPLLPPPFLTFFHLLFCLCLFIHSIRLFFVADFVTCWFINLPSFMSM